MIGKTNMQQPAATQRDNLYLSAAAVSEPLYGSQTHFFHVLDQHVLVFLEPARNTAVFLNPRFAVFNHDHWPAADYGVIKPP